MVDQAEVRGRTVDNPAFWAAKVFRRSLVGSRDLGRRQGRPRSRGRRVGLARDRPLPHDGRDRPPDEQGQRQLLRGDARQAPGRQVRRRRDHSCRLCRHSPRAHGAGRPARRSPDRGRVRALAARPCHRPFPGSASYLDLARPGGSGAVLLVACRSPASTGRWKNACGRAQLGDACARRPGRRARPRPSPATSAHATSSRCFRTAAQSTGRTPGGRRIASPARWPEPLTACENDDSSQEVRWAVRGTAAGSVAYRSEHMGAAEDAASRRQARPCGTVLQWRNECLIRRRAAARGRPRRGSPRPSAAPSPAFEPGLSPTITAVVFFETESVTFAPFASSAARACSRDQRSSVPVIT